MRELWLEIASLWQKMKSSHKAIGLGLAGSFVLLISFIFFTSSPSFLLLYPEGSLLPHEKKEIETLLVKTKIAFKEKPGVGLLVPLQEAPRVRLELASMGLANKSDSSFDFLEKGSWLRGERELQLLEMKAIRAQLEKDIASFESVRSARVFLDLGSGSRLRAQAKPKASVLLTLTENGRISPSSVFAIAEHVASAIPTLEVNRIAISDIKGKIYQTISDMSLANEKEPFVLEEKIKSKAEALLGYLVGSDHFFVECTHDQRKNRLGLSVLIDDAVISDSIKEEAESQIRALTAPFTEEMTLAISSFHREEKNVYPPVQTVAEPFPWELIAICLFFLLVVSSFFFLARWLFSRKKEAPFEEQQEEEDELSYLTKDVKEEILTNLNMRRDTK